VYPGPKFQWHKEIPTVLQPAEERKNKGSAPSSKPSSGAQGSGALTVNVDSLKLLVPANRAGPHQYVVSAGYYAEPSEVFQGRKCKPIQSTPSADKTRQDCKVGLQFLIPYNSKQSLVKVLVYQVQPEGDVLIGDATVPMADTRAMSTADWPILRDHDEYGKVLLDIQFPDDDEDDYTSVSAAPAAAAQPSRVEKSTLGKSSVAGSTASSVGSPSACHSYNMGDRVEVYSNSAGKWLPGTVVKLDATEVTIDCGDKLRAVDCAASNVHKYLRRTCVVGDFVECYSRSSGNWVAAKVSKIIDANARTIEIQYDGRGRIIDLKDEKLLEYFRFPGTTSLNGRR